MRDLVAGTFLEGKPIVRTSAATGQGIDALREALRRSAGRRRDGPIPASSGWPSIAPSPWRGTGRSSPGRWPRDGSRSATTCSGTPKGGRSGSAGLHRHDRPVERVGRGTRAAINLVGVHHSEIRRGQEIGAPGYLEASRVLSVELQVSHDAARPLRHRGRYRLHLGTAEVSVVLALLESNNLGSDGTGLGQLFLSEPVVAVHGQPFVLREESPPATLGGGRVLQPSARRIRRRDHVAVARLARLRSPDPDERLSAALAFLGMTPWTERALCRATGIEIGEVSRALARLSDAGKLVELPLGPRRTVRVLAEFAADLEDRVLRALARLHAAHPRQSAIPRSHVAATLPDIGNDTLVAGLLDRLKAQGKVVVRLADRGACRGTSPS